MFHALAEKLICYKTYGASTPYTAGFFLTPAAEKTKTQAQTQGKNSRKKLNLRGAVSSF